MVSLAGQCLPEQVREPQAQYADRRLVSGLLAAEYRNEQVDMAAQTLQSWVARMSLQNHAIPTGRSANITERVSVPSSEHVAEIVGRQGCKIKALRDKTGTYIKTPVRGEEPVFIVTGRPEDVITARKEILAAAEHFTQIRASRSRGSSGSSSHYSSMPLSYGSLAAPSRPPDNEVTIKVRVPYRVVGLVVGPKGSTIKRIQQTTNTFIVTPSRDREPCFEVTGTPQSVELARTEIETYIAMRTRNSDEEDHDGQRSPGHRGGSSRGGSDSMHPRLGSTNSSGLVSPLLTDSESPFGPTSALASAVDQLSSKPWGNSYFGFSQFGVTGAQEQAETTAQQHVRMVQTFPRARTLSRDSSVHSSHSNGHRDQDIHHRPVGLSVSDATAEALLRPRSNESLIPDSHETMNGSAFYGGSIYGPVGSPTTPSTCSGNTFSINLSTPSGSSSSAFETSDSNVTSAEEKTPPRKECYMCFADNGKEAALVPCGHLFCHSCAIQIYGRDGGNRCPVNGCGVEVEKVLRIRQDC